jgi:hypothetical protein
MVIYYILNIRPKLVARLWKLDDTNKVDLSNNYKYNK